MLTPSMFKASFPERHPVQNVACEQAFRAGVPWRWGGKRKENLLLHLWNLTIEKVNVECCRLAEMTLVMMSLPLARFKLCFFYICTHFRFALIGGNLTGQLTQGATGEFKFQRHSCKLSFYFLSR